MSEALLKKHRRVWYRKSALRFVYEEWYRKIKENFKEGKTLEIGSGSGNLKECLPEVIGSEILYLPWVDITLDAHNLPFKKDSFDNIVLFDVLHHIENPMHFFKEAVGVLKVGGRIILMEPYVSPLSFMIYRFLHPEPLKLKQDPFNAVSSTSVRKPFDANQAVPTLIFKKHLNLFQNKYPELSLIKRELLSFFAYPLSGGFDHPSLLPFWALKFLTIAEKKLSFFADLLAFRIFVVLKKI